MKCQFPPLDCLSLDKISVLFLPYLFYFFPPLVEEVTMHYDKTHRGLNCITWMHLHSVLPVIKFLAHKSMKSAREESACSS